MGRSRAVRCAKRPEIVPAYKPLSCGLHPLLVQPGRNTGVVPCGKGRIDGAVVDVIDIGLGMGGVPGMKIQRHHPGCQHPDIRGQITVQRQGQFLGRDAGLCPEIQRKAQSVDPGIGAAASFDIRPGAQHRLQSVLHRCRHAAAIGLHLEAAVRSAVIGEGKKKICHN